MSLPELVLGQDRMLDIRAAMRTAPRCHSLCSIDSPGCAVLHAGLTPPCSYRSRPSGSDGCSPRSESPLHYKPQQAGSHPGSSSASTRSTHLEHLIRQQPAPLDLPHAASGDTTRVQDRGRASEGEPPCATAPSVGASGPTPTLAGPYSWTAVNGPLKPLGIKAGACMQGTGACIQDRSAGKPRPLALGPLHTASLCMSPSPMQSCAPLQSCADGYPRPAPSSCTSSVGPVARRDPAAAPRSTAAPRDPATAQRLTRVEVEAVFQEWKCCPPCPALTPLRRSVVATPPLLKSLPLRLSHLLPCLLLCASA